MAAKLRSALAEAGRVTKHPNLMLSLARDDQADLEPSAVALFDALPQLACIARPDGSAARFNRRWYEYTGTRREDVEGWSWERVLDPAQVDSVLDRWRGSVSSGAPFEMNVRIRGRDGSFRWFATRAVPVKRPDGTVSHWLGVTTDIDAEVRRARARDRVAEAELRASEERFHHLVDAVTDYAIFMLDANGHVATWNAGAQATKGYRADEIVGKHFEVFYTPEDRAAGKPQRVLETVRRDGRFEDESWRVRKNGSRFWANVVITALRDSNGEITGFAKVTRDLTTRRAAEENQRMLERERQARESTEAERRRLLTLLQEVPAIVNYFRGPELVFEFAHPKTVAATGGRELLGNPLFEVAPELFEAPYDAHIRDVFRTGTAFVEREARMNRVIDGRSTESYWDVAYLPIRDGGGAIEGVLTFDLDVTASVRARKLLEQANHENARAREELERLNRAKDEFLATMSHELRTPLNAICGWASILRNQPSEPAKLERGLEVIERNARTQVRLVSDLLDVSRIVTGKLRLAVTRTEVLPLVHQAAEVVRPAAESKGVRLLVDVDPEIGSLMADPDRLQQVLWNLLVNAVRYTPRGGRILLRGERTASAVEIVVEDTGTGIAAEHLPHIFERFRQVDSSTTRAHGGLGLGLAIVRHLVEAHGGQVDVRSEGLGKGASFTLQFPTEPIVRDTECTPPNTAAEVPHDTETPAPLRGIRILAVDDDPDSLELLRELLHRAGAEVRTATNAHGALSELQTSRFDILLSDIGMPEMDGYALIRSVRSRIGSDVPAIALTAYARTEDVESARQAGYQAHLTKPIDPTRLIEAIQRFRDGTTPPAPP